MSVTAVSPTAQKPKHHITLSDGTTTVGLIAVQTGRDKAGEITTDQDENAIDVAPSQQLAIQTSQGNSQYSDREWPYMTLVQDDWSGGRGGETFEDDTTRYYDGKRANTWREGELLLGPMVTYTEFADAEEYMPGDTQGGVAWGGVTWEILYGSKRYRSDHWTQDGAWICDQIVEIYIKKIGSPGTLTVRLADDNSYYPKDTLVSGTNDGSSLDANVSYLLQITMDSTQALGDATVYHIEAWGDAADDATNHWEIGCSTTRAHGKYSANQADYTVGQLAPYYRILESYTLVTKTQTSWVPFEYKGALYAYNKFPYGASYLFLSGDRGVADSNSGNLDRLIDISKSWADDLYNGLIVKIIAGPGSDELQPWRTIVDTVYNADSPYITVSPDWNKAHTNATEYVIVGSNKYTNVESLGNGITDHALAGNYIYFAGGETGGQNVGHYEWYRDSSGDEQDRLASTDPAQAKFLLAIHHPEDEHDTLYMAKNDHAQYGVAVGKMKVPGTWNDLVFPMGQLASTDTPWADRSIAECTQTTDDLGTKIAITDTFTTGLVAVKNLDAAVDITQANQIGFWVKSSKSLANTVLYFSYGDFVDTDGSATYTGIDPDDQLLRSRVAGAVYQYNQGTDIYTHVDEVIDGKGTAATFGTDISLYGDYDRLTIDNVLHIMADFKFNDIAFNLGTPNDEASVMSAQYFDGTILKTLTIADGTDSSGDTLKTDNGSVTFAVPEDWEQITVTDGTTAFTGYAIFLDFSAELTDDVTIVNVSVSRYNANNLNLGALTINEWKYVVVDITPEKYPAPDDTQIQSIGLYIEDDQNTTFNIMLRDGIDLLYDEPDWKPLPSNDKITGMIAHNGNVNEPRTNPWIFTEGSQLYEMQSQNDDQFIPVTIGEMGAFRSENTGAAACVNDVYLYFSLGEERIERWFNNSLDDIGPDGELYYGENVTTRIIYDGRPGRASWVQSGIPSARKGRVSALLSYPGRVYAAVSDASNTASILMLRGSSWHEVYRAPRADAEIKNLYHQVIPGDTVGKLWFDQGGDLLWIPVTAGDPRSATSYEFTHEGRVETGWFYAGMKDITKIWNELKIFAENVGANYYVEADYKTDADTTWTAIAGTFDTEPSEALDIASTPPSKKRLKIRLRLYSKLSGDTPEVKAMLIEAYGVTDIKYVYTLPAVVADQWDEVDLQGDKQKALGYATTASTAITKLRSWASAGTPLTLHSNVAAMDDSTVVLEGPPLKPIRIDNVGQAEKYLLNVVCRDV